MQSKLFIFFAAAILIAQLSTPVLGAREISFDDGNYVLWWDMIPPFIQFKMTVKTRGWVGLGFSFSSSMTGSDLILGGIADQDSTPYFDDYHAVENGPPIKDIEGNLNFIPTESFQDEEKTVMTFMRLLITTDSNDQDMALTDQQIYVLWAYGPTDNLDWHQGTRGSQILNLFREDEPTTEQQETTPTTTTPTTTTTTTTTEEELTTTENWVTTTTLPGEFVCPAPSGHFSDPQDCAGYYVCENGEVEGHHFCPEGLYFNPRYNNCDFPWNVDCPNKHI